MPTWMPGAIVMTDEIKLRFDSEGVRAHLGMVQGVITRMAENSRSCKLWCVTLVAATLVLVARTGEPQHSLLALLPTTVILLLDSYYLALERAFRKTYDSFVTGLHEEGFPSAELYVIKPTGMGIRLVSSSVRSMSIVVFYPAVIATVLLAWQLILSID